MKDEKEMISMNAPSYFKNYAPLLRTSALFHGLSREETEKALDILGAEYGAYEKGAFLHRPYTEMKKFGLVLSGAVQACMDDVEGNRMIMADVAPGVTFGEALSLLKITDSPVYVCASEMAEVLWLSAEALFGGSPDGLTLRLQKQFAAMLSARTLAMNDRIQVLSKIKLRDKLLTYFTQLSQSQRAGTFLLPMNREDLAAYLGTNHSALSRELSNMKKEGLIDYRRNSVKLLKVESESAKCGVWRVECGV